MSENETPADERRDDGFELEGEFFRFHVSDCGKDLMLIDRIAGMPVTEFFEVVDDEFERGRGPILLTIIATSIRAAHPDWSVERIVRKVMALRLSDVDFLSADVEQEDEQRPPVEEPSMAQPVDEPSPSPSNGSWPSSIPAASSPPLTSSAIPR